MWLLVRRATIDASTRDKKNSRSTKATFCQNMDSTTALCGKEREKKTENAGTMKVFSWPKQYTQ